ncbi:hypothetical protein [Psychroserpens sp.]|uniref:hypothetical protein n=1 Tax=Psychroserpens sp. TaxID=2020870 RepID=UPI001B03FC10|nr:hypothetical protein [Psychroserpens sp.]MBO6607340.1 hypothetical protein [Psychroserpens sp.]MBO6630804.1 hypothetical protein [Psychroserpens sp.]MBO6654584.1 hypothetical protein [Psychroserpens sp.]MBO6681069.1 hypothetical protein [Psychroserpens sp.]MBO6749976.1 hypothetical protein [Psychroserpens sp.]
MKILMILKFEWIHFIRNPFKLIAILLFMLAAAYGINNGSKLYHKQIDEIDRITTQSSEDLESVIAYYDNNQKGPESRPWVDVTTPFWAIWYASQYSFKEPSKLMVYGIGQAEQYGYYKKVTMWSSPYDADMAEEIANPERLNSGQLDFTFVILFLMPLLLIICLYNIKGTEYDRGILSLIKIQSGTIKSWVWTRLLFYALIIIIVNFILLLIGGTLTDVFSSDMSAFWLYWLWINVYLFIWVIGFGLIIQYGQSSVSNTLKMIGLWLLLGFIIPGSVHQWISTSYPTNLMTDFIDSQRDERNELYDLPDEIFQQKLNEQFPDILNSVVINDSLKIGNARNRSASALANELTKASIVPIEDSFKAKNKAISATYWFNPVTFFQNRFNQTTKTHFDDYQIFRNNIQTRIDRQVELMVMDIWNDETVDKNRFLNYLEELNGNTK